MEFEIDDPSPKVNPPGDVTASDNSAVKPRFEIRAQSIHRPAAERDTTAMWLTLRWLSRIGLYAGLALYVSGSYFVEKFDEKLVIENSVRRDPVQHLIESAEFPFEYRGHRYQIQPVASYDISGLVVTHNDISSIADAYHTSDSVDFRDICVVWGANVGSGVFRRLQFWSMPWSCHVKSEDRAAYDSFVEGQLSNNHLLAADEQVRKTILKMKIGDQIRLQGKLINYWHADYPEYKRKSSLTRKDTGDGACEVLWVERAEILRAGGSNWYYFKTTGWCLLLGSLCLGVFLFIATPLGHYRRFRW